MIRAPICTVVGHVDHGKTTLLDAIRGTAVAAGEAGAITQAIGASIIPIEHIKKRAGDLLVTKNLTVPGLLFIDTPGHAAFTGMRKRGGSLADIAVLLVDINEGFKPQTKEALEILRSYKTPFIVAANKIDKAPGFLEREGNVLQVINAQTKSTQEYLDNKLYQLVGELSKYDIPSERFDRVESFEKSVAIVPISALKVKGIDALLAVLVGLAQRYLEKNLGASAEGPARGTILEVTEEQGMGLTLNAIIYDGKLDVGDTIIIGALKEPIVTKVRALFQPSSVGDIRDSKTRFRSIEKAVAATGVKISAPDLEGVTAGMPFAEVRGDLEEVKKELAEQVDHITINTDESGVVVKADNIGSLEALISMLRGKNIPIRVADIGPVSKKDLAVAASHKQEHAVVLAFNLPENKEPVPEGVKVIQADIIYQLIDEYDEHLGKLAEAEKRDVIEKLPRPARLQIMANCVFRQSHPMICGVDVQLGTLRKGAKLVLEKNPNCKVTQVDDIQDNKKSIALADKGMQVAVKLPGVTCGRQLKEGDVLWATVSEEEFRELKKHQKLLGKDEVSVLKEFAEIMRKTNPVWGI